MKQKIIEHLIDQQRKVITDLETAIKERQLAADIDEDDTRDADDFAQQEVNKDFVRRFRDQLEVAQKDLSTLKSFVHINSDEVAPGALVDTDKFYIVVGASVQNDEYDGKKVICMSEEAPAFEANKGKTKGDELMLGPNKIKIKSIS